MSGLNSIRNNVLAAAQTEMSAFLRVLRQHERFLPAVSWIINPLWQEARWSGTSYQFDRTDESPPVMGLTFENPEKGKELFKAWTEKYGNHDELEEIRITVIEGEIPDERPGYFIHICPDPENSMVRATAEGFAIDTTPLQLLGQLQKMNPVPGTTPMLPRFKELFEKHREFLFAPVCQRDDGRLWVELKHGIVKRSIHFRNLNAIDPDVLRATRRMIEEWQQ